MSWRSHEKSHENFLIKKCIYVHMVHLFLLIIEHLELATEEKSVFSPSQDTLDGMSVQCLKHYYCHYDDEDDEYLH